MAQFSAADPIVILSYARTPMGSMQGASPMWPRPILARLP
jgi:hypothetical protein